MENGYQILYYFQTDIICAIIISFVLIDISQKKDLICTENSFIKGMLFSCLAYAVSDMIAITYRGTGGSGTRMLLYGANEIYIAMPLLFSFFFSLYIYAKVTGHNMLLESRRLILLPIILSFLFIAATPFTHAVFYLDEQNLYHRTWGAYIVPLIAYVYAIILTAYAFFKIYRSRNPIAKENMEPILWVCVLSAIGTGFQLMFYGLSITQASLTLSLLFMYVYRIKNQILTDELTGLKNRRECNYFIDQCIHNNSSRPFCICMVDANNFKHINDTLGHTVGDQALKMISATLSTVCTETNTNIFVGRYGGDEFLICGDSSWFIAEKMRHEINQRLSALPPLGENYKLSVSFGFAQGNLQSWADYTQLVKQADEAMYEDKQLFYKASGQQRRS